MDILQEKLCLLLPDKYLLPILADYRTLLKFRRLIGESLPSEELFLKVLEIIEDRNRDGYVLRNEYCSTIKVLKKKNDNRLNAVIRDRIFGLLKDNIAKLDDERINDLSVALKDTLLSDDQIEWMLKNAQNQFVLNRVLRYPFINNAISGWAKIKLKHPNVDRKSELIGRILDVDVNYTDEDMDSYIWGLYYSRMDLDIKKSIISKLIIDNSNNSNLIEVAARLGFVDLLEKLYENFRI